VSTPKNLVDLTELADSIGAAGAAEDGVAGTLAKGMVEVATGVSDALKDALGLLRKGEEIADDHLENDRGGEGGEGTDMGDNDGGEGGASGGVTDDGEEDGGGDGYEDMELGAEGYVDVTEFVSAMHKGQTATFNLLKQVNKRLEKTELRLEKAEKDNARLTELVEGSIKLTAGTVGPLTKGVLELSTRMAAVSERPMELGGEAPWKAPTRRALARHGVDVNGEATTTVPLGGDKSTEVRILAKAMGKRIIGEDAMRRFNMTGMFVEDEAANAEIRASVLAA